MATLIPSFKKDNPFESINDNELIGLTFNDQDGPSNNFMVIIQNCKFNS